MEAGARVVLPVADKVVTTPPAPHYLQHGETALQPETVFAPALSLARDADVVVAWNKFARMAAPGWLRRKAHAGDELCDIGASEIWMKAAPPVDDGAVVHRARFEAFVSALRAHEKPSLILASGPSLAEAAGAALPRKTLNVWGGSAIANAEALSARPPDMIAIPDIAGQSGPSMTAARYRERLFGIMRRFDGCHALVPEPCWRSLAAWWPDELKPRVIAVPETRLRPMGAPFSECFAYEPTSNVLTAFLLPAAASMSREIHFIGVDGAAGAAASVGWRHDREKAYASETLEAALSHGRMHISALSSYYERHWRRAATECAALRERGVVVHAPPPIKKTQPDPKLAARRQASELARFVFQVIEAGENRPATTIALAALGGGVLGGLSMVSSLSAIVAGAVLLGVFSVGYLTLRWRINRMVAAQERERASVETRALTAMAARIDLLEERLLELEERAGAPRP